MAFKNVCMGVISKHHTAYVNVRLLGKPCYIFKYIYIVLTALKGVQAS